MNFLRNIHIFSAILTVTALIIGIMAVPSIIVFHSLQNVQAQVRDFDAHTVSRMSAFGDFKDAFNRAVISTYEYVVTRDEVANIRTETLLTEAQVAVDQFAKLSTYSPQEVETASNLQTVFEGQKTRLSELRTRYEEGVPLESLYMNVLNIRTAQIRAEETIHNKINTLVTQERQEAIQKIERLNQLLRLTFFFGITFSILLSGVSAFFIARLVSISVQDAQRAAGVIADGDLGTAITATSKNEFGSLMLSLEHMRQSLKSLVDSKDNFVALVSHQLRTPLTVLRGNIELLLSGSRSKESLDGYVRELGDMHAVTLRLVRLVNDILDISKASAETAGYTHRKKVSVPSVVAQIVTELQKESEEARVVVQYVFSQTAALTILVNEDALRQVLSNLIENAIKYSAVPETGFEKESIVKVEYVEKEESIEIQIKDSGIGIPTKDHAQVFQKFFRASNVAIRMENGNGLGLFLVKLIVDRIGGTIRFESVEGKGTTFYLTLPR